MRPSDTQLSSDEEFQVHHHIYLCRSIKAEELPAALQFQTTGNRHFIFRVVRGNLNVRYDARQGNIEDAVALVKKAGFAPRTKISDRLRYAWCRFTDNNIRDNAVATGACCSHPPPGAGKTSEK